MTQPNFQRRRLSNTIEVRSRYSTLDPDHFSEAVKLPALNSINKSVKYNDISFSFSRDLNKLRKQPEADPLLAESMAHGSLLTVRKRYDNLNKQREQFQNYLKDLEREKQKFNTEKEQFQEQKDGGKAKVLSLETTLKELKTHIEEGEMEKKVMMAMIARLRHDKVVYDQLKYNAEKELEIMAKQKKIIVSEDKVKREEQDRTKKVYLKMVEHISQQSDERDKHIGNVEGMIDQKIKAFEGSQVKKAQMKEVAENTLAEKDQKQKNWYKVYLCHRLVEKILQNKMEKEMEKFSTVERAYKNIKLATGVNTAESLIFKFLNKEGQYGALLAQITREESRILELKAESDALNLQRRKLKAERDHLSISKQDQTDLSKEQKEYQNINSKASSCYLFEETIKMFLDRTLKKYKKLTQDKHTISQDSKEVLVTFRKCLDILKQEVEAAGEGVQEEKGELGQGVTSTVNVRVNIGKQQDGKRAEKVQKQATSEFNEEDFINDLRLQTLRNNEKFMRQIKKKHEQLRKQKIEGEPKRKEPQFQKPKQAEQP